MKLFMKGDKRLGVFLLHMEIMRSLVGPAFHENQTVGIICASVKIICQTARLGAGGGLCLWRGSKDLRARAGLKVDRDDELIHRQPPDPR